jgi:hypothetical protein
MTCVSEDYRDRRVIHALRPQPIVAHKITQETPYLFGLHPLALIVPAVLAIVLMVVDPLAIILGGSQ